MLKIIPRTEFSSRMLELESLDSPYALLSTIKALPENAKTHDITSLVESLQTYGFVDPIGVNPETGIDWDGNGRREALMYMMDSQMTPPRFIIPFESLGEFDDGNSKDWLVPVNPISFDEVTQRHLALRLNRENEKGGYDEALLIKELQRAQAVNRLDETGYDESALLVLLAKENAAQRERDKDERRSGGAGDFTQIDPNALQTDYQCPQCLYEWSGKAKPGRVTDGTKNSQSNGQNSVPDAAAQ